MSECEQIVKEHLDTVEGLADLIVKSDLEREVLGLKLRLFQPIKLLVGAQYVVGIIVRITRQSIMLLDALGQIYTARISKINMIATIDCSEYKRHREMYRIRLRKRWEK